MIHKSYHGNIWQGFHGKLSVLKVNKAHLVNLTMGTDRNQEKKKTTTLVDCFGNTKDKDWTTENDHISHLLLLQPRLSIRVHRHDRPISPFSTYLVSDLAKLYLFRKSRWGQNLFCKRDLRTNYVYATSQQNNSHAHTHTHTPITLT